MLRIMLPDRRSDSLPSTPADDDLRASDREREQVVRLLKDAAAEGRLDVEELETRTEGALRARTRAELAPLTRDLPSASALASARLASDRTRRGLQEQLARYLVVSLIFVVVWAATGADYFWPLWPMLGWGLCIAKHVQPGIGRRHRRPGERSAAA